jgi:hypothetical protein
MLIKTSLNFITKLLISARIKAVMPDHHLQDERANNLGAKRYPKNEAISNRN